MSRVLFLGQKPLGERAFEMLQARPDLTVAGVCSNAEATGTWWGSSQIQMDCPEGIPFLDSSAVTESRLLNMMEACRPDVLISVQHPQIIPPTAIEVIAGRAFNLHLAPLPEYKGFYGVNHAILNGDSTFGATLHWMTNELDGGDIVAKPMFPITPEDTALTLYRKAESKALDAYEVFLDRLVDGAPISRTPQLEPGRMFGRNSLDGLQRIDDPNDDAEVRLKVRAFHFPPFKGAYIEENGRCRYLSPDDVGLPEQKEL